MQVFVVKATVKAVSFAQLPTAPQCKEPRERETQNNTSDAVYIYFLY